MLLNHIKNTPLHSNINTSSNQTIRIKDTLSYQIESALKEYESLQNKLSSIKGKSYPNIPFQSSNVTSPPKTPIEIKTPHDSRTLLPQVNQKQLFTPSSRNVMNEFKALLHETELAISSQHPRNTPQQIIQTPSYHTEHHLKPQQQRQQQPNPLMTPSDILNISNQVLNKSNLDLKNLNRVLEIELKSYKHNSSTIPFVNMTTM